MFPLESNIEMFFVLGISDGGSFISGSVFLPKGSEYEQVDCKGKMCIVNIDVASGTDIKKLSKVEEIFSDIDLKCS